MNRSRGQRIYPCNAGRESRLWLPFSLLGTFLWCVLLLAQATGLCLAQEDKVDLELKVAFMFNFLRYSQLDALEPLEPIRLCIPRGDHIQQAFSSLIERSVDEHPIELHNLDSSEECEMMYLPHETRKKIALYAEKRPQSLLVADWPGAMEEGAMVRLFVENDRLRFEVAVERSQRSVVKLSSKILRLAVLYAE